MGEIHDSVERIGEMLVLAEPGDRGSLTGLKEELQSLRTLALDLQEDRLAEAAAECTAVVEIICEASGEDAEKFFAALPRLFEQMRLATEGMYKSPTDIGDAELLQDFVAKANEYLDAAEEELLDLERGAADEEGIDNLFRALHTVKGMAGFLSLEHIRDLAHRGEGLLEPARGEAAEPGSVDVDEVLALVDTIRSEIAAVAGAEVEGPEAQATAPEETNTPASGDGSNPGARTGHSRVRETIRVDAERLDQLLDAIGELVIAESMASRSARMESVSQEVEQQLGRLDKLTRQLHEMAGSLRMVPLRPTFQRMSRAIRDLCHQSGKEIEFVVEGAETELDKAVVDRIADPLLHLIRNAVDHGIEADPKERAAHGKPRIGRIELRAYHKAGSIFVEVEDDGRGIDREAVVAKAQAQRRRADDGELTDRDILNLIFEPGFSTAEVVTDVSGRGVGMDVVKRSVESLGGQVAVRSTEGTGTTFVLRLPITLAVIDGMVVQVADERYIVPTLSVVRSVRPSAEQLTQVFERASTLQLEDELIRLIEVRDLFGLNGQAAHKELTESIVMIVENDGQKAGLVIDEIVGQQQIVIKSLGESLGDVVGVSGGAVMPDGRVGLILDVGGLVVLANET